MNNSQSRAQPVVRAVSQALKASTDTPATVKEELENLHTNPVFKYPDATDNE
jgi:hypothetical protein